MTTKPLQQKYNNYEKEMFNMRRNFKKTAALALAAGLLLAGLATGGVVYASETVGATGIIAASGNAFRHCFNLTEDGQSAACLNGTEGTCNNENCTAENRGTCTNENCISEDGTAGTCMNGATGTCTNGGTGTCTNGETGTCTQDRSQTGTGRGNQTRRGMGCFTN